MHYGIYTSVRGMVDSKAVRYINISSYRGIIFKTVLYFLLKRKGIDIVVGKNTEILHTVLHNCFTVLHNFYGSVEVVESLHISGLHCSLTLFKNLFFCLWTFKLWITLNCIHAISWCLIVYIQKVTIRTIFSNTGVFSQYSIEVFF